MCLNLKVHLLYFHTAQENIITLNIGYIIYRYIACRWRVMWCGVMWGKSLSLHHIMSPSQRHGMQLQLEKRYTWANAEHYSLFIVLLIKGATSATIWGLGARGNHEWAHSLLHLRQGSVRLKTGYQNFINRLSKYQLGLHSTFIFKLWLALCCSSTVPRM